MVKRDREIKQMIIDCGLQLLEMSYTGKSHIKVKVQAGDGRTSSHIFSNSCSDHRAGHAARACLRRFAKGVQA